MYCTIFVANITTISMLNVQTIFIEQRKVKDKTQSALAKELGISRRAYQRIESGNGHVRETEAVCAMLGLKMLIINENTLLNWVKK